MILELQNLIRKILKHPFLMGSLVMMIGSNIFNLGQFIYHFLAGRLLGKAHYGDLAAIISIIGVIAIIQSALGMTIVKSIAGEKEEKQIHNLVKWFFYWSVWVAVCVALASLLFSPIIADFLNITQKDMVYLLGPILLFYLLSTVGRSILQGLLKFNQFVISLLVELMIKIPLSIVLILAGFATLGAMGGLLGGVLVSFFYIQLTLSPYLKGQKEKRPQVLPLVKYSSATFVQGLALTSMYSADLMLVKHFFDPDQAGIYASLAVLGRIVFFGVSPIANVMFPLVAKRHASGRKHYSIFILSLMVVSVFALVVIGLFYFFPNLIITTLYGQSFVEGAKFLWWFGVFMFLLALAMLFTQYYLSINKTRIVLLFILAAISQIFLIWFIHPQLLTVIQISILVAALLVTLLLLYFFYLLLKGRNVKGV